MKRITVLLVEDHAIVREGLRTLLELDCDFEVVGEAATGREAVELARKVRPAVVVMDIALPELNGFEATRQILLSVPGTKVLVLSAHGDDEFVAHMAAVGASGYLVKRDSGERLLHAIKEIASGRSYFSPLISKRPAAIEWKSRANGALRGKSKRMLSSRETEVLRLLARGAANLHIATELGISIKTVEKHRQQVMNKLGIHTIAGLTSHAVATGVIEGCIQVTDLIPSD